MQAYGVYAAGDSGHAVHWNGTAWADAVDMSASCTFGVALGASAMECVNGGSSAVPFHFDGEVWDEDATDAGWVLGLAAKGDRIAATSDQGNGTTLTVSSRSAGAGWQHAVVRLPLDDTKAYSLDRGAAFLSDGRLVFTINDRSFEEPARLVIESP